MTSMAKTAKPSACPKAFKIRAKRIKIRNKVYPACAMPGCRGSRDCWGDSAAAVHGCTRIGNLSVHLGALSAVKRSANSGQVAMHVGGCSKGHRASDNSHVAAHFAINHQGAAEKDNIAIYCGALFDGGGTSEHQAGRR